jgi:hypothetical protein
MYAYLFAFAFWLVACSSASPSDTPLVNGHAMGIRLGILHTGQSNVLHPGRGEVGSLAAVGYFAFDPNNPSDGTGGLVVDLVGATGATGGSDLTIGKELNAAGVPCDIIDLTAGSTQYNRWQPTEFPAADGALCLAQLPSVIAQLQARHPGDTWIWVEVRDQGTTDSRVANLQYQSGQPFGAVVGAYTVSEHTAYPGWAAAFRGLPKVGGASASWHDALEDKMSQIFGKKIAIPFFIVESNRALTGQTFPFTIQDQQAAAAGDSAHLIPLRDLAGFDTADQVHMIAASCTITTGLLPGTYPSGGYQWKGTVVARNYLIPYWQGLMGSISVYAKNVALNNKRNKGTYSPPASHWFAAYVGGVRKGTKSITNNATLWPAASGRTKVTGLEVAWDAATGSNWGDVDEIRIFDADPSGAANELGRCTLAATVNIAIGEILRITAGAIQLTLPAGGFTDSEVRASLDLLFGGTAESPRTNTHLSYFLGDPRTGGTILGSSVSLTQASAWAAAANGVQLTAADISLAQQLTATHVAEHTSSGGGGSLISVFTVQTPPGSGTITAGRLQSTIP